MGTLNDLPLGHLYDYVNDGSQIFSGRGGYTAQDAAWTPVEMADAFRLTSTSGNQSASDDMDDTHWQGIIFPAARLVTGFMLIPRWSDGSTPSRFRVYTSATATSCTSGTWDQQFSITQEWGGNVMPTTQQLRNGTHVVKFSPAESITGIRFDTYYGSSLHVNSYLPICLVWTTDVLDGLNVWDPTLDQPIPATTLDMNQNDSINNVGPLTRQFRIKNTHSTLTAQSVVLAADSEVDANYGNLHAVLEFDVDGGGYNTTQNLGNLAPGAISPVITMLRPAPANQVTGTGRACLVKAIPTAWA